MGTLKGDDVTSTPRRGGHNNRTYEVWLRNRKDVCDQLEARDAIRVEPDGFRWIDEVGECDGHHLTSTQPFAWVGI